MDWGLGVFSLRNAFRLFNLDRFIAESVTFRPVSMFAADIEANKETQSREIKVEKVRLLCDGSDYGVHFKYA